MTDGVRLEPACGTAAFRVARRVRRVAKGALSWPLVPREGCLMQWVPLLGAAGSWRTELMPAAGPVLTWGDLREGSPGRGVGGRPWMTHGGSSRLLVVPSPGGFHGVTPWNDMLRKRLAGTSAARAWTVGSSAYGFHGEPCGAMHGTPSSRML